VIDSHCHLDRVDDLEDALTAELRAFVTVGTDLPRSRLAVELAERDPRVFAVVGVHPNEASLADDPAVRRGIEELADHPRVVAIGETGFDDHWRDETLETQRRAFDWHASVARATGKPLVLHVRDRQGGDDASRAAERALRSAPDVHGVLHCFGGDPGLLSAGLDLGWMVSFAGNLTYKSASRLRDVAAEVPADRLLVETDAPFLTPVPHRGKRNRPAWVVHTARVLAEVRGERPEALERRLDANAERFYRLPPS
jgi:TatD DNase family protein